MVLRLSSGATHEDLAFRMLGAGNFPKHRTIRDFGALHLKELSDLFVQVVKLAREMGLVKLGTVAIDGTTAVQRALCLLEFMPRLGRPGYPGVRTWPLKHFPYTLAYRVKGGVITVMAVAHQSREPGYWRGR